MPLTSHPLRIIIVGAGIGGLAAATCLAQSGHQVQVLEAGHELSEIGAGIQVTPNAMRILDELGLKEVFYEEGTKNEGAIIRRYSDGKFLGRHRASPVALYKYYNLTLHRADYQRILYDAALKAGAEVKFEKRVVSVDTSLPSLTLEDGTTITGDLLVGADGIGSKIRTAMFPDTQAHPTPDCAFRIILTREQMLSDPAIAHLVERPSSMTWFGPGRHIVAYTIRGTDLFNVVFCGPGTASVGLWNEPASLPELREEYSDFEETVRRILNVASTCHKWRIGEVPDLPGWRNGNGRLVLLGDAAHAMMPYMAQGATQSLEDAAILAGCLERVISVDDIPRLTRAYEDIRKPRAEKVKATSLGNMRQYGLPDGPEQEARDEMYMKSFLAATESTKSLVVPKPDMNAIYGSPGFSAWIYTYDVKEVLRGYFGNEVDGPRI